MGGREVCWPCLGSPGHCSPTLLTLSPVCLLPVWQVGRISSPAWAVTEAQATNQITGLWSPINRISMPWITRPRGTVCPTPPHPLPSQALALRAIGPHQTNSSLCAWGLGSWGTQGLVLSLGPKGKKTPEAAVGGWREVDDPQGTKTGGAGINSSCPTLREQGCNNFQTVTSQSYCPLEVPDGTHPLPWNLHQTNSGYSREKASAVTPIKEVSAGPGPGETGSPSLGWRKR